MDHEQTGQLPGQFTDAAGRSWLIEITVLEIQMLRKELKIDLLNLVERDSNLIARWSHDPCLLVDTISLILTPQIEKMAIDGEAFARGLKGGFLAAANDALIEAIAHFFEGPKGSLIRAAWNKAKAVEALGAARMQKALESNQIDQALERRIDQGMEEALRQLNG